MSTIPKAIVHIQTSVAVSPTEEQLLEFFKPYGYNTLEEILEGQGDWSEVIREWFVNTYYGQDYKEVCEKKNIFNYDSDEQEDEVEILYEGQWEQMNDEGLIF